MGSEQGISQPAIESAALNVTCNAEIHNLACFPCSKVVEPLMKAFFKITSSLHSSNSCLTNDVLGQLISELGYEHKMITQEHMSCLNHKSPIRF